MTLPRFQLWLKELTDRGFRGRISAEVCGDRQHVTATVDRVDLDALAKVIWELPDNHPLRKIER